MNKTFDEQTVDLFNKRMKASPAFKLIDMEITSLSKGRSELEMRAKDTYLNIFGTCHGGITAAFADTVMGVSLQTMGAVGPTIEMNVNFMAPITSGQVVVGKGEVLKRGRSTAVIRADLFVDKTMVAAARGTYSIIEENEYE